MATIMKGNAGDDLEAAVSNSEASRVDLRQNSDVLSKLMTALLSPGVVLEHKRDVPYYSVDGNDPSIVVRLLNGVEERGRMVDGVFKTF